jgi:hypothetical protein
VGHFASKGRRYSTTLGAIRRERRIYRQRQVVEDVHELIDEDATLVANTYPGGECGPGGRIEH